MGGLNLLIISASAIDSTNPVRADNDEFLACA
jgi:hypothetical protein